MEQNIKIPNELYQRLGIHAKGFDTPANVIERLLDFYEENTGVDSKVEIKTETNIPTSLEIVFYPSNEADFQQKLIKAKKAYLLIHKADGSSESKEWNASNITESSNIRGNLRSGHLRGWKRRGIVKAEVSTNRTDLN